MGGDRVYENLHLPIRSDYRGDRPYVILNMVQSANGRTDIGGKASGLGTYNDRSVMRTLRSRVDAVMVGGGTIRAEKLSLSLDAADTRAVPRAVVLSGAGDLPLESNLVRDSRQCVLVLLAENAEKGVERRLGSFAEIRRVPATGSGAIDLTSALGILKRSYGIGSLLCEGGPTINQALITANLADELFITVAPTLVGTDTLHEPGTVSKDRYGEPTRLGLISSYVVDDELFLRYSIEQGR